MNTTDTDFIWWKHGVVYHIYVRSFYDSNGDGVGDLQGIISKLDYLKYLGVDALWLSPIYKSPMIDFGYDVEDYYQVDPQYGSMMDFTELVNEAKKKDIRIIMDMVMNHTSSKHKWFIESRFSTDNEKRDWYIWQKKSPNNWKTVFGDRAWRYDFLTRQYYFHSFFKEQPDLNWRNPEVKEAFFEIFKFWMDLGVDGFRLDVINMIVKDRKLRNNPSLLRRLFFSAKSYTRNRSSSIDILKDLRKLLDSYDNKMSVGEIFTLPPGDPETAAKFLSKGDDALNMTFDFSIVFQPWNAKRYYRCIERWQNLIPEKGWPCNVFSNHDVHRHINRVWWRRKKTEKAKLVALLLFTLRGTPFIYYGEEIGMKNVKLKRSEIKDKLGKIYWPFYSGRDKSRTPMQWTAFENAGFSEKDSWLPVNKDFVTNNVVTQVDDKNSLLNLYKDLIELRKRFKSLSMGKWIPLNKGENGIISYSRVSEKETTIVYVNFTGKEKLVKEELIINSEIIFSIGEKSRILEGETLLIESYGGVVIKLK